MNVLLVFRGDSTLNRSYCAFRRKVGETSSTREYCELIFFSFVHCLNDYVYLESVLRSASHQRDDFLVFFVNELTSLYGPGSMGWVESSHE